MSANDTGKSHFVNIDRLPRKLADMISLELERSGQGKRAGRIAKMVSRFRRPGDMAMIGDREDDEKNIREKRAFYQRLLEYMSQHYRVLWAETAKRVNRLALALPIAIAQLDNTIDILQGVNSDEAQAVVKIAKQEKKALESIRDEMLPAYYKTLENSTQSDIGTLNEINENLDEHLSAFSTLGRVFSSIRHAAGQAFENAAAPLIECYERCKTFADEQKRMKDGMEEQRVMSPNMLLPDSDQPDSHPFLK